MRILAIESSCDETGAAVVEKKDNQITVLSNILATSSDMHAATGGIIPENAAREQVKVIIPVIVEALIESRIAGGTGGRAPDNAQMRQSRASIGWNDNPRQYPQIKWQLANTILRNEIDAIAITYGPGLIGSLLIGVETAKTLSLVFNKPIIPVNHLLAHIYANYISVINHSPSTIHHPYIGLIVSGGHTDLLYFKSHNDYEWLGGTRDDAAGEAIDKIGRMLDLSYPAGPEMEKRASMVKTPNIKFQSPMINSNDFDFSFSGLKAEVMRYVKNNVILNPPKARFNEVQARRARLAKGGSIQDLKKIPKQVRNDSRGNSEKEHTINNICYATQKAVTDVLVKKTIYAAEVYNCKTILIGGGVSANQKLNKEFKLKIENLKLDIEVFAPGKTYATDNAAMIGAYALMNGKEKNWKDIKSNPELYFV